MQTTIYNAFWGFIMPDMNLQNLLMVSRTEKVLALYPTINRLNMGELVVSKNQSTRWVKLGQVVKES